MTELTDRKARGNGAGDDGASMTIDELARRTGMTVRNIRAHQSRGLVPPPEVRGRTGYYGDEHLARIELIKELQADGFNLEAIRRLLEGAGGSSTEVLDFSRALRAAVRGRAARDPRRRRRSRSGGARRTPRSWSAPSGSGCCARSARAATRSSALASSGRGSSSRHWESRRRRRWRSARRSAARPAVSRRVFVDVFIENVWKPFNRAGRPEEEWPQVREALERLRPLASEALLAIFQQVMSEAVEEAAGRQIRQELRDPARGKKRSSRRGKRRRR